MLHRVLWCLSNVLLYFIITHILKTGKLRLQNLNNLPTFQTPLILEPRFIFRSDSCYDFIWDHNNHVECLNTTLHRSSLTLIMTCIISFLRSYTWASEKVNNLAEITQGTGGTGDPDRGVSGAPPSITRHNDTKSTTWGFGSHFLPNVERIAWPQSFSSRIKLLGLKSCFQT